MTLDEIRSKAPTKKATHYSINDNKVIYLKKNKSYGWDYWHYRWIYCCNWFKDIKPIKGENNEH